MFEMNLQLFGGGGSKSGLGGGGGSGGKGGSSEKPYFTIYEDAAGERHRYLIWAKNQNEANKLAIGLKKDRTVKKVEKPVETTKEKAKRFEERN